MTCLAHTFSVYANPLCNGLNILCPTPKYVNPNLHSDGVGRRGPLGENWVMRVEPHEWN